MMENNRDNRGEVLMTGVADKLRDARELAPNVPYELHHFCDYLADVSDNREIAPLGMMVLLSCALNDLKKERCGFANKVDFPEILKEEKYQIAMYMSWFPLIVDNFGNEEFAKVFREIFEEFICKPQPPVAKVKTDFGVKIVEKGVVDISNKDKAEVLAALYNASHPHGMGFLQYNPEPMTVEEAKILLDRCTYFDYLNGRVMKVNLEGDIVNVSLYNVDNGEGAAEKAISTCPNIS